MHCKHSFVRGDHVFARSDGCLSRGFGRAIGTAHKFNKNINIFTLCQCNRIVFPCIAIKRHTAIAAFAARAYGADCDLTTRAGL